MEEGATGGTITSTGVYTAAQVLGTYHVVASSIADSTKSDTALVTVPPVSVAISPRSTSLARGETVTFTATATGSLSNAVTWSVLEGAAGGTITSDGLYTAPATLATYRVIATSVAHPTQSATAPVTVVASGFRPTGSVATGRENHTATLLNTGNVLVAGGFTRIPSCCETTSAELFDPVTETFAATGGMAIARDLHTATLLQNGKVLVAGGDDCQGPDGCGDDPLASAELYK